MTSRSRIHGSAPIRMVWVGLEQVSAHGWVARDGCGGVADGWIVASCSVGGGLLSERERVQDDSLVPSSYEESVSQRRQNANI